jgi:hypothetical protein
MQKLLRGFVHYSQGCYGWLGFMRRIRGKSPMPGREVRVIINR